MKKNIFISFIISLVSFVNLRDSCAENNVIAVYCNREVGQVNKKVFGNNFLAYDPTTYEDQQDQYYGYSNYGAGVWDPVRKESVENVMNLAKQAGVTVVRFPGGCGTHHYNWKAAIGNKRRYFLYGIDEFLKICEEIGAESVITVSYFVGKEGDAADLIEYLKAPNDKRNPNGGIDWAAERARNGHNLPYKIKCFEIGNEAWHGDHRKIKKVSPEEYASRYLNYYNAMKAVDSSVNIGAILNTPDWNRKVLEIIKDKIDFGIIHIYPSPEESDEEIGRMNVKDIFLITLGPVILKEEQNLQETLKLLKEKTGRDIPLAITEYNGGFVQERPVPYRHCLMTALVNAELLKIFMKSENHILMANYWHFCNSYWGMIANGFDADYKNFNKSYYKRPNYYVYELYRNHFGDILIKLEVKSGLYNTSEPKRLLRSIKDWFLGMSNTEPTYAVPYLSVNASKSRNNRRIYLMVINKNIDKSITTNINLGNFIASKMADAWVLNGPMIDCTNEKNHHNVMVRHKAFEIKGDCFQFNFAPHSLTAIEINGSPGE